MTTKDELETTVHDHDTKIALLENNINRIVEGVDNIEEILGGKDGVVTQTVVHKSAIRRLYWINTIIGAPLVLLLLKAFLQ